MWQAPFFERGHLLNIAYVGLNLCQTTLPIVEHPVAAAPQRLKVTVRSTVVSLSESKRWWPRIDATALFSTPPFPGSRAEPSIRRVSDHHVGLPVNDAGACVEAIASFRVGGTFWAGQPDLPARPYVLARPVNATQLAMMIDRAAGHPTVLVLWLPDRATCPAGAAHAVFGECDPWHLLSGASHVWVDADDELSFLAAVASVPQIIVSDNFLPHEVDASETNNKLAALMQGVELRDPFSGKVTSLLDTIETLGFWRELIDANRAIGPVFGVSLWKRGSIAPMLWNGRSDVQFASRLSHLPKAGPVTSVAWIARTPAAILKRLTANDLSMVQIEDGFIRSVGLGADCVPPLSIVVDPFGAHYDPAQPSALELLLTETEFTSKVIDRAQRLRKVIVKQGISKYGRGNGVAVRAGGDRRHVLVTGQVEDDQSVIKGGGGIASNLELLRRVRAVEPDAFIIYRPHPDVDAGHRKGYIEDNVVLTIADSIAREDAITSLIDMADDVHVLTSLAGFEALMRGKSVTTHGVPFYAGWGLTTDLGPVPARRLKRRSLDELVAATLLLYPRYLDPVTGLPCPPEILIERLSSGGGKDGWLVYLRRAWGRVMGPFRSFSRRRTHAFGLR